MNTYIQAYDDDHRKCLSFACSLVSSLDCDYVSLQPHRPISGYSYVSGYILEANCKEGRTDVENLYNAWISKNGPLGAMSVTER